MEEPGAETPGPQDQDPPPGEGATPARARPRGRTTLLIAAAAALGVLAGTCTGYLVQADREPTALPPLSQPTVEQSRGKPPRPLSATTDKQVRNDGDLRELLLKKPRGARDAEWMEGRSGWLDLADYADFYGQPGSAFGDLAAAEFRRGAITGWQTGAPGTRIVEIRLLQYRNQEELQARNAAEDAQVDSSLEDGTDSWSIPGTSDGMAYVHRRSSGSAFPYNAEAFAWRGDIAMELWVYGTEPIGKKTVLDLAARQMEQL
ncbi:MULTISPECIES: hypothetical protein [unclassified Streptomyces]|uniref:hypothetical protein n=1 Tax=unclassified Streptomyces TaxID=2593676 RepID=UPI00382FDDD7